VEIKNREYNRGDHEKEAETSANGGGHCSPLVFKIKTDEDAELCGSWVSFNSLRNLCVLCGE